MRNMLAPVFFWCGSAFFLICANPMSPPGAVPGLSSFKLAGWLFLAATIWFAYRLFVLGAACRKCERQERILKRAAYTWLGVIAFFLYFAITDLVHRGAHKITLPLLIAYGLGLFVMSCIYFTLRYWKERSRKERRHG